MNKTAPSGAVLFWCRFDLRAQLRHALLPDSMWVVNWNWGQFSNFGYRPEAASQLTEMTHPNRPFISASEGQQVLISIATTSATIG